MQNDAKWYRAAWSGALDHLRRTTPASVSPTISHLRRVQYAREWNTSPKLVRLGQLITDILGPDEVIS
jgi:hypothetical protein